MTDERMALVELLQKRGDGDFLRAVAEAVLQILSRRSRNQTGLHTHATAPRPYGQFWMIRRSTSARFVPADAGAKDKNPMGSMLFSAPIIASSVPDCHQILRKSCQESVRKGLRFFADRAAKKWPLRDSFKYAGVLLAYPP